MMQLKRRTFIGMLVVAVAAGIALGSFASSRAQVRRATGAPMLAADTPIIPVQMPLTTGTFAQVAEVIKPAVVNITVNANVSRRMLGRRTPFEEFFGEEFFRRFFGTDPEQIPQRSLGSGVIVDASGIALTNYHVVAPVIEKRDDVDAQIEVITLDGSKHKAKVVGHDKRTDLAVLRLDEGKGNFKAARVGDSEKMQVGDWVIAVGSPFGLQATVTAGIISATARQIPDGQSPFTDFLQTDAAINPGNSGGPLVNMQGEVVGINTAIASPTGGSVGIGFAIPSNTARKIYTELVAKGKVSRGWLGVSIQPLTEELAKSFGAKDTKGVLVSDVIPDGPAAKAGLKPGDIVLEYDGKKTEAPGDLQRAVGLASPGADAKVKVWREQKEQTVTVKIGEMPDERQARASTPARSMLGVEVRPVTPEVARQLNLPSAEGVVVARVEDGSAAAESGVQRGDVIREINRQRVKSITDFERLTKDVKEGDRLTVLLQRGPMSLYVAFTVGRE
jgi:serine protease Do